jgi:dTDP-4-dehydrorhamnose 3,5-epimerase-like enzyme
MTVSFTPSTKTQLADQLYRTPIDGLYYLDANIHADPRGNFSELVIYPDLNQIIKPPFVPKQVNLAHSLTRVARGFHAEPWRKLITVVRGTIFGAIADVRPDSSTFARVVTFTLGERSHTLHGSFFVDQGLANAYLVLDGPVNYLYCVDALYRERSPQADGALSLFDTDLNVTWPLPRSKMILSSRDQTAQTLRQRFPQQFSTR